MNPAKKIALKSKQFVTDHKVAIAVVATTTVLTAVHLKIIRNTNARLTELGINLNEFYNPEV